MESTERARLVLQALVAGGVRDLVVAPGSRSAPLALLAHAADAAGALRLHVRLDERTAGFLALGLGIGSRRPAVVVTTSGTAVGNLLPAVMEAHHAGRPLVVVSADRPEGMRGTGANQTTWQEGIFGRFARCVDLGVDASPEALTAAAREALASPGPVHLNLQLAEPLVPATPITWSSVTSDPVVRHPAPAIAEQVPLGPRTIVLAGDDAGPGARELAERAGWPLLAEPTSGARAGANAVAAYRLLLETELGRDVQRVVVMGHPTLSRPVTGLLAREDVEVLAVRHPYSGIATDPARRARHLEAEPTVDDVDDLRWLQRWRTADQGLTQRLVDLVDSLPELHALQVALDVGSSVQPQQALVCGSSNPIRDLDLLMPPSEPQGRRRVVANRGLAGIDGTVSTAIGLALGRRSPVRTTALVGDVTFLHDATGLIIGPDEARPDLTVVVVNDDGGSIFALLEQGGPAHATAFERVFATPHHVDLAALCAASGTAYRLVATRAELRAALADPSPGLRVVEARVMRTDRREMAQRLRELA